MNQGDLVKVVHPGGLFGPMNTSSEIVGIVVEPPNEVSVEKVIWFCGRHIESLPTYIHVEEIEVIRRAEEA